MALRQRGTRRSKVKMPCGDTDVESYQEARCAEELYISKTWKQARDQQTEKFAGSFKLTYGCTFSLTFFAKRKCGNRCLTPLPLCIDWKQQEKEDKMSSSSSLVLTLWRTTDGQRSKIGYCELRSKTERGVGFFCVCADAALQHQQSASPPDICQRHRGTSYFHQELWWLRSTAALEICWAEKKRDESLILQSKQTPTITVGEEAWGEYRVMLLTHFCGECGRNPSPPASKPNTPIRPLYSFEFNGFSGQSESTGPKQNEKLHQVGDVSMNWGAVMGWPHRAAESQRFLVWNPSTLILKSFSLSCS